ncbi:MAG: undecaprenyl-diphosphate phosphatase [Gammaproteobacteria bacterium]
MSWLQALLIALIQGITEFLPVSSSAHLILVPVLTGWQDQGVDFDVIVHAGSLVAIVAYFRNELNAIVRDWWQELRGGDRTSDSRLGWWVLVGTLPAATAGWLLKDFANGQLRDPVLIAVGLIVFGIVLGIADWKGRGTRDEYSLTLRDVLVIGFAQVLALFPGTSRAGITMTAALFVGLSRDAAARFSFLLSVPIIAAATLLSTRDLVGRGAETEWGILLFGFVVSAASTYAMVHLFLSFIRRIGMQPFVIYRVALGVVLLAMFW